MSSALEEIHSLLSSPREHQNIDSTQLNLNDSLIDQFDQCIPGEGRLIIDEGIDDYDEGFLEEEEVETEIDGSHGCVNTVVTENKMCHARVLQSDSGIYDVEQNSNVAKEKIMVIEANKNLHVSHGYDIFDFTGNKRKSFQERIEALEEEVRRMTEKKQKENLVKKSVGRLVGIGECVSLIRNQPPNRNDVSLLHSDVTTTNNSYMRVPEWISLEYLVKREMFDKQIMEKAWLYEQLFDVPPPPSHPTKVKEVQKLVRSTQPRCKICKSRFGEKILVEFHIRDKHPDDYPAYELEQEREAYVMRTNELEQNRLEEIIYGGFIPPEKDYMADNVEYIVEEIPLPGELTLSGRAERFVDTWGTIMPKTRKFTRKVSPQCPFCDKRFRNEFSLKKHFFKMHPSASKATQCRHCFKIVEIKEELAKHDCDMSFLCFECHPIRNLCTAIRLANHRAKFHRGANSGFKCLECSMKFLTPRKLRKHRKMSHVFTKTYQCHFCDEHFISEISVTTHERIHTGIIKFECTICDYRCNRYLEMDAHKKEEHGYLCSICQSCFGEWADLKAHTLHEHGGYLTSESNATYVESPRVWVMFKGE